MGLFDSYMDTIAPASAPQSDGSLIDRLLAQYAVQSQYQPAQSQAPLTPTAQQMMAMVQPGGIATGPGYQPGIPGAPPAPSPAQAPASLEQASPLTVGGYQMPRMGNPDLYQPQQVMTPPNAQPTQGQMPAQVPLPPQLQPMQTDGLGNHLAAGARNFFGNAHGGLLSALVSGAEGLATGQRNDPQALQQQSLNTQFQALMAAGVPREKAILAVINPEFAKTIIPQALSTRQKFVQLKDAMGAEHLAFIDETSQTVNGQPIADYNKQQSAASGGGGLGNMDLTGKDYLASIPVAQRGTVQGMVEGTLPPPSSFALQKPYWQNMIAAAKQVDPTWDAANWSGRVVGMKSFKSGSDAGTVRSANQVLGHISDLTDKADELHNSDYPSWNYVKNKWNSQAGEDAANNWVTQAHAVADEMSAFMKGAGHSSDTEIRQWQESLSPNMSPQQQRGAIKTLMGIYDHALQALEDKRTGAVGSVAAEKMGPLVTTAGQRAMDKVRRWAANDGAAQGAAPATTKTGVSWSVEK